jgi:hypothetical protein
MKNGSGAVAILGFLAALVAAPAIAQDRGLYLGGAAGASQYKDSCERANVPCDDNDVAWRAFTGYQLSRHGAIELGFANLGKVTGSGTLGDFQLEAYVWDFSGVFSIPVTGSLSGLLRIGMYRARTTVDQQGPIVGTQSNAGTNSGFTYGAGVEYRLWRIGLRGEWQRYAGVGGPQTGRDEIDVFSLGALFRF